MNPSDEPRDWPQDWNHELDELLRAVVVGELAPEDPRVQQACERSPEFRARLADHRRIEARMARYRAERANVLDAARTEVPGEEQVLSGFRARTSVPARTTPDRGRSRWPAFALLAAAVALVASILWRPWAAPTSPPVEDGGRVLDANAAVEPLAPLPGVTEVSRFAWKKSADARVLQYELTVFDASPPGPERLVIRTKTPLTEYVPRVPLPRMLIWSVQPLDATGSPVGSAAVVQLSY